jgi:signal transduction histidine kinase/CheY-like chemotaxis protein
VLVFCHKQCTSYESAMYNLSSGMLLYAIGVPATVAFVIFLIAATRYNKQAPTATKPPSAATIDSNIRRPSFARLMGTRPPTAAEDWSDLLRVQWHRLRLSFSEPTVEEDFLKDLHPKQVGGMVILLLGNMLRCLQCFTQSSLQSDVQQRRNTTWVGIPDVVNAGLFARIIAIAILFGELIFWYCTFHTSTTVFRRRELWFVLFLGVGALTDSMDPWAGNGRSVPLGLKELVRLQGDPMEFYGSGIEEVTRGVATLIVASFGHLRVPATLIIGALSILKMALLTHATAHATIAVERGGAAAHKSDLLGTGVWALLSWTMMVVLWCYSQLATERLKREAFAQRLNVELAQATDRETTRELMAVTFHELRNPLNGTEGYLRIAGERLLSIGNSLATGGVHGVIEAAQQLELLAADIEASRNCTQSSLRFLRTLSSVQRLLAGHKHEPKPRPIDLHTVVAEAATIVKPLCAEGVELRVFAPPPGTWVVCDGTLLLQSLTNLAQNSARFTASGHVLISCQIARASGQEDSFNPTRNLSEETAAAARTATQGGAPPRSVDQALGESPDSKTPTSSNMDGVHSAGHGAASEDRLRCDFVVCDTGTGMSEEVQRTIFERYVTHGGVGLGMWLTRKLLEELKSTIQVESHLEGPNRGSEFRFSLDLLRSNEPADSDAIATHTLPVRCDAGVARTMPSLMHKGCWPRFDSNVRLLLADDSTMNLQLLAKSLEALNSSWQLDLAVSGEEAFAKYKQADYDIIILDELFDQSILSGHEVAHRIREWEKKAALGDGSTLEKRSVIILCTGSAEAESLGMHDFDAFWDKPIPSAFDGTMQRSMAEIMNATGRSHLIIRNSEPGIAITESLKESRATADSLGDTGIVGAVEVEGLHGSARVCTGVDDQGVALSSHSRPSQAGCSNSGSTNIAATNPVGVQGTAGEGGGVGRAVDAPKGGKRAESTGEGDREVAGEYKSEAQSEGGGEDEGRDDGKGEGEGECAGRGEGEGRNEAEDAKTTGAFHDGAGGEGKDDGGVPSTPQCLVADDVKTNRWLLQAALKSIRSDWAVVEATTAEEAIELVRDRRFQLIIMDELFEGPDRNQQLMNGCCAIQRIRELESKQDREATKIISCSGFADGEGGDDDQRFFLAGADAVWSKPFPARDTMDQQLCQLGLPRGSM